jgi:hypothetical protein
MVHTGGAAMRLMLAVTVSLVLMPTGYGIARTWEVNSAGTGDAPTIQAGIDSAGAGDTVRVMSGTYYEHDIQVKSGILLTHQNSLTENCTIDAGGQGRVLIFDGVDVTTEVKYMTFTGGHAAGTGSDGCGGALFFTNYSAPTLYLCDCPNNVADAYGGAVYCEDHASPNYVWGVLRENQAGSGGGGAACASDAAPTFNSLHFTGNTTPGNGGGAHCTGGSTPTFRGCNVLNCKASGLGGGIYTEAGSVPAMDHCILAFNMDGEGFYAADDLSVPAFDCCDIYGNEGGDWVGRIADQDSTNGNFSFDPLFCDTTVVLPDEAMDVEACSPCLFGSHPYDYFCGRGIGYVYTGCECGEATRPAMWGTIKSLYR